MIFVVVGTGKSQPEAKPLGDLIINLSDVVIVSIKARAAVCATGVSRARMKSGTSEHLEGKRYTMPIPSLDAHGLLPVGVHECSLDDVEQVFCWNAHRVQLFQGLQDFVAQQWAPLGIDATFWVNGSFTRKKEVPEDIDLVADVSHVPVGEMMPVIQLHLANANNKATYHVDFWFKHPIVPNDLTNFFQYTGLKAGAELGLDAKHPKGILKVTL